MKLSDVLSNLEQFSSDYTIYAEEPWTIESEAIVDLEPTSGELLDLAKNNNMKYFLEVFVASDVYEDLNSKNEYSIDKVSLYNRIIQYAVNDA